jgi:hypothetical protein
METAFTRNVNSGPVPYIMQYVTKFIIHTQSINWWISRQKETDLNTISEGQMLTKLINWTMKSTGIRNMSSRIFCILESLISYQVHKHTYIKFSGLCYLASKSSRGLFSLCLNKLIYFSPERREMAERNGSLNKMNVGDRSPSLQTRRNLYPQ